MRRIRYQTILTLLIGGWLFAQAKPADACNIPVYRYALERWPADPYEVIVVHRAPLSDADQGLIDRLAEYGGDNPLANLQLRVVDLDDSADVESFNIDGKRFTENLPRLIIRYPRDVPHRGDLWSGRLSSQVVSAVVDSPLRKKLARRLASGQTAVWVFVESGNKPDDDAAIDRLEKELARLEKTLQLPEPFDAEPALAENTNSSATQISFSVLRTSRADGKERVLLAMLLNSEPDLKTLPGPMALPIFGRGRALYALVGAGINPETIEEACRFLIGPCSCQVKDENPGVDLLLTMDWQAAVTPFYADTDTGMESLPAGLNTATASADSSVDSDADSEANRLLAASGTDLTPPNTSSPVTRNLLILVGLGVLVLAGTTLGLRGRKSQGQASSGI